MTRNKSRIKDRQIARRQAKAIYAAMKTKELQFERGDVQIEAAKSEEGKEKRPAYVFHARLHGRENASRRLVFFASAHR